MPNEHTFLLCRIQVILELVSYIISNFFLFIKKKKKTLMKIVTFKVFFKKRKYLAKHFEFSMFGYCHIVINS